MAKKPTHKDFIIGIDIGTSKIVTLVGEVSPKGTLNIIGMGSHPSHGLKKGIVVNIEDTVQSIQHSVAAAEAMVGCEIFSAYTGIAGSHIRSLNSHGIVAIKDHEVTPEDVERVLDAAQAIAIPADQKIIHVLPQEFTIDQQDAIREPIGMAGVRLEAKVHIVTGAVGVVSNIVNCLHKCGLTANDIVLEQFASSQAVLSEDEKELGVCMIDIGGGTTDIAVFTHGAIRHTAIIPIAGDQVSNDLAIALRTPTRHAEQIKINFGCALQNLVSSNETIEVSSVGERSARNVTKSTVAAVIEARYEELFHLINAEIQRSGCADLITAGVIITGGASKITGLLELAENILQVPVRLGLPQNVSGLTQVTTDPIYATSVGLLLYGVKHRDKHQERLMSGSNKSLWGKIKSWLHANF